MQAFGGYHYRATAVGKATSVPVYHTGKPLLKAKRNIELWSWEEFQEPFSPTHVVVFWWSGGSAESFITQQDYTSMHEECVLRLS